MTRRLASRRPRRTLRTRWRRRVVANSSPFHAPSMDSGTQNRPSRTGVAKHDRQQAQRGQRRRAPQRQEEGVRAPGRKHCGSKGTHPMGRRFDNPDQRERS